MWNLIRKQTSEHNRTRDMEIKNKLTVIRAGRVGDNMGEKREGRQGTCMKDTWQSQSRCRIEGGRCGGME